MDTRSTSIQRSRSPPLPSDLLWSRLGHADHCDIKPSMPALKRRLSEPRGTVHHMKYSNLRHSCHDSGASCHDSDVWAKAFDFQDVLPGFSEKRSEVEKASEFQDVLSRLSEMRSEERKVRPTTDEGMKPGKPPDVGTIEVEGIGAAAGLTKNPAGEENGGERLSPSPSCARVDDSKIPSIIISQPGTPEIDGGDHDNARAASSASEPMNTPSEHSSVDECNPNGDTDLVMDDGCLSADYNVDCEDDDEILSDASDSTRAPISCPRHGTGTHQHLRPGFKDLAADADQEAHISRLTGSSSVGQDHGGNGGNNGNRRSALRSDRRRTHPAGRYHCVFLHSGRVDETDDCGTRKLYVSQLRRHHDRHGFYYCSTCFRRFPTQDDRDSHVNTNVCLLSRCVTEDCPNYDEFLALLPEDARPCGHGGRNNSGRAQWRYLFKLARPHEDVPEPEPQRSLPQLFPPSTGASMYRDSLGNSQSSHTHDDGTSQQAVITQLAQVAGQLHDLSRSLEQHPGVLEPGIQTTTSNILDNVQVSLQHLRQLAMTVNSGQPARPQASDDLMFLVGTHFIPSAVPNGQFIHQTDSHGPSHATRPYGYQTVPSHGNPEPGSTSWH